MNRDFSKKVIWSIGLFILIFFFGSIAFTFVPDLLHKSGISQKATVIGVLPIPVVKTFIKMAFVGDIMLDRGVRNSVYKNFSGDYSALFNKVKEKLETYDILFGNLEGPISARGADIGGIYSFRFEPKVASVLKNTGFDVLSVANNHTFNWSEEGFVDTLGYLSNSGILYIGGGFSGSDAYKEKVINIKGVKMAFLAFSDFQSGGVTSSSTWPGIAIISEKDIQESTIRANQNNDIVVVSYHFGDEYETEPNSYQEKYAGLAIDSGADLVIGHHPHVVQKLEPYKDGYVVYSLGNFIFDQNFSTETMQGGLLEVEINPETKKIEKVNLKKVSLNNLFQIDSIE